MKFTADFMWPAIFAVSIKTQLYGYFYRKDENPAVLLTLLALALLLRKLSAMGGVVIPSPPSKKKITKCRKIYHPKLFDLSLSRLEYFLD